jgi:DNA invertase Pin-like site-specific DNA recombinase
VTQPARCAAVYARVSTDKQSQLSTSDQVRNCPQGASTRNLIIHDEHIYVDEAMSGVGSDRPAFQRMLSAAVSPAKPFSVILVDDTSRLSRNTEEALGIFRRLNFAGVQLIAVSQGIDSTDDQAEVLVTVHGMVDSLYVKELAKKTHRGLEGLVLRGLSAEGRCFGYETVSVAEHPSSCPPLLIDPGETMPKFKLEEGPFCVEALGADCLKQLILEERAAGNRTDQIVRQPVTKKALPVEVRRKKVRLPEADDVS